MQSWSVPPSPFSGLYNFVQLPTTESGSWLAQVQKPYSTVSVTYPGGVDLYCVESSRSPLERDSTRLDSPGSASVR